MKITFAILFCAILGLTTAKHLFETEDETANDMEPDQIERKIVDITKGVENLFECLNKGGEKHKCFKQFKAYVKLPPQAAMCGEDLEKCLKPEHHGVGPCLKKFAACVHSRTPY